MNPEMGILVFPLMWSPAIASVSARLVLREGFADVSFRFGGRRNLPWIALGLILPVVVGTPAYGTAWLTGLVGFHSQPAGLVARLVGDITSPVTLFVVGIALASTIGAVFGCLLTAGGGDRVARLHAHAPHRRRGASPGAGERPDLGSRAHPANSCGHLCGRPIPCALRRPMAHNRHRCSSRRPRRLCRVARRSSGARIPSPSCQSQSTLRALSLLGASTVGAAECGVMRHMS
jgi:hypothetical protein